MSDHKGAIQERLQPSSGGSERESDAKYSHALFLVQFAQLIVCCIRSSALAVIFYLLAEHLADEKSSVDARSKVSQISLLPTGQLKLHSVVVTMLQRGAFRCMHDERKKELSSKQSFFLWRKMPSKRNSSWTGMWDPQLKINSPFSLALAAQETWISFLASAKKTLKIARSHHFTATRFEMDILAS